MDQQESKVIDLITHLPPNVNPYLATANMLEAFIHSPRSPPWSRHMRIAILVLFEIMLFQSSYLLYQRYRMNEFTGIKCNNLGLVNVNISITSGVAYFLYAIMTIYVLLVRIALDLGHVPSESVMMLVFGLKFFTVILASCAFLWVCACQCAKIAWNSNLATKVDRNVLRNIIKWGVSISFVIASFGPLIPICWKYVAAYEALCEIELIGNEVISTLRQKAKTYEPQNLNQLSLLSLLIPAKKLLPLQDCFEINLRHGQKLYLAEISLLSLLYLPLLFISLRALYRQSLSQGAIDAAIGSGQGSNESPVSNNIRRQRQRLVYHAFCVYFATSVHFPVVLTQIIISRSPGFVKTTMWQEMTFQGINAPLAITGNIILAILNLHAYCVHRESCDRGQQRSRISSRADNPRPNLFQKLNSFGLGFVMSRSDNNTIELRHNEIRDNDRFIDKKNARISVEIDQKDAKVSLEDRDHVPNGGIRLDRHSK